MQNKFLNFIFLLLGIIIGIIIAYFIFNELPSHFFDINLYHVLNIAISLFIGIFIALYLNGVKQSETRKKEFIIKICNDIDFFINDKKSSFSDSLTQMDNLSHKKTLLHFFKVLSSKISVISTICNNKNTKNKINSATEKLEYMRNIITGNDWNVQSKLEKSQIDMIMKDITDLENIISLIMSDTILHI